MIPISTRIRNTGSEGGQALPSEPIVAFAVIAIAAYLFWRGGGVDLKPPLTQRSSLKRRICCGCIGHRSPAALPAGPKEVEP